MCFLPIVEFSGGVLVAATKHKEVVFVTCCNARPYQGADARISKACH